MFVSFNRIHTQQIDIAAKLIGCLGAEKNGICIFVTTLKTNSDAKTRTVLNAIARHKCPLLIVQNMLDSVEPSADGSKTKEMVAAEHKKRLLRIVDNSQIEDKNSVKVIQVSAIYAMRERCDNIPDSEDHSKYQAFRDVLMSMIKIHFPYIEKGRLESVYSFCRNLIDQESKNLSGDLIKIDSIPYEKINTELKRRTQEIINRLGDQVDKIQYLHQVLKDEKQAVYSVDSKSITKALFKSSGLEYL